MPDRGRRRGRSTVRTKRAPRRDLWVGWKPYGIGETKPNHYAEMLRTVWENKRHPLYAWRILRRGVCDGCALGVAGFHDWTIDGVHLCTTRLNLLKVNTASAMKPATLSDVASVRSLNSGQLRELGRLAYPMVRRAGDAGFTRVSWDVALDLVADRVRTAGPDRFGVYLTARGLTNEVYYAAQKAVRAMGSNNIDNAARVCHAPSTAVLTRSVGAAATTISYGDLFESDLVILFGSNAANAQPVTMKYLYLARKGGTKVAVVNPYREPALERYWVPSNVESALFGTRITDEFFAIHTGGDVAFINGVLKVLAEEGGLDDEFIAEHTAGFDELRAVIERASFAELEAASGATVADMRRFADLYRSSRSAVFVWSMGITQHAFGSDNVQAIVNLALARGNMGRPGAGLMPIRGHSGVQGGAEMGAYATVLPGGVPITAQTSDALSASYGFSIASTRGLTGSEMVEAAGRGELDVLWSSGGNFLEVLPDPDSVRSALERVPVRVHQDIVITTQMLVDPGDLVVLLPAMTRYEQPGGGTETTTERRIAFSPEIRGPRPGEARAEWWIFAEVARRAAPDRAAELGLESAQAIRDEIARVVPLYDGVQHLAATGDQVQWGGPRLCDGWVFPTDDGRAHFVAVEPPVVDVPPGKFMLSTRRGKQFNSMVWKATDPLTGAERDALFMAAEDAGSLGVADGDPVTVRSEVGEMAARVKIAPMRIGNVQVFWPEGNVLIASGVRDTASDVPDYNAIVSVVRRETRVEINSSA